jgi:hypothetical protein
MPGWLFTDEDEMIIRAFYPLTNTQHMIDTLLGGRHTVRQVISKVRDMQIKKHALYKAPRPAGFKKGCAPWNKGRHIRNDPVSIRERSRPKLNGQQLTHAVWEEHHGRPVPPGHVIWSIDRDVTNCDISNLELISKQEMMKRNACQRYSKEMQELFRLKASLTKKINNHVKKQKHHIES